MALFSRSLILVASLLLAVAGDAAEPVTIKFCEVMESPADDVISVEGPSGSKDKLLIRKAPLLDSSHLKEVYVGKAIAVLNGVAKDRWTLSLTFTDSGSKRFAEATEKLLGKRLAILANDKVLVAPFIRESITGGRAEISGSFTEQELKDLADAVTLGIQQAKGAGG
jgi:preprotein translocase subunit SecD